VTTALVFGASMTRAQASRSLGRAIRCSMSACSSLASR
jgi:hypothetical protein